MRSDGRTSDQLRTLSIEPSPNRYAEGSALIRMGFTHVLATVSLEEKVPPFLKDQGRGWVTAEYGMLPRSTHERSPREAARGKQSGRTQEIQRLIGRSLRSVVNFEKMGVRTATIDCDVIQADGGTRCASIGAAFVALALAFSNLKKVGVIAESPLVDYLAAVSVGIVDGEPCLDLCYTEDSAADVDMNVVMTGKGELVEVQGTAEHRSFSRKEMDRLLDLAWKGISEIVDLQKRLVQI